MSVKNDVRILLELGAYNQLINLIETNFPLDTYERDLWESRRTEIANFANKDFILIKWNYVSWDEPTNELVQTIETYIKELQKNNAPVKYIALCELGITTEIESLGPDDTFIAFIKESMYVRQEIKVNDNYFND